MKNTTILGVEIHFLYKVDRFLYDLGAVTLKKDDREYILDVVESWEEEAEKHTVLGCKVVEDRDTFSTCNYDLTDADLLDKLDVAEIFVGGEEITEEPEYATLFIKQGGCTKAIDLTFE